MIEYLNKIADAVWRTRRGDGERKPYWKFKFVKIIFASLFIILPLPGAREMEIFFLGVTCTKTFLPRVEIIWVALWKIVHRT